MDLIILKRASEMISEAKVSGLWTRCITWLNENNVDYYGWSDATMIAYCLEHGVQESVADYKTKLFNFLDAPWQEDVEISIVEMVSEYRDMMANASEHQCRSYLGNFMKANASTFLNVTDAFQTAYDELS